MCHYCNEQSSTFTNFTHGWTCPISLAEKGQWFSTTAAICNCIPEEKQQHNPECACEEIHKKPQEVKLFDQYLENTRRGRELDLDFKGETRTYNKAMELMIDDHATKLAELEAQVINLNKFNNN